MTRHTQPPALRFLVVLLVLFFGLLPSVLLFIWLERNMALPILGPWLAQNAGPFGTWPLVFLDAPLLAWILFDFALIGIFGCVHSSLAGGKTPRPLYIIATGISSLVILLFWQPTGIVLYQAIPSAPLSSGVSFVLFWSLTLAAGYVITRLERPFPFVGLAPRETEKVIPFHADGLYAHVRHPGYALTLLAWVLTPMLSLDRLVFTLAMGIYLWVGIRLEEKRLLARYGEVYRDYQARVPMLFPLKIRSN